MQALSPQDGAGGVQLTPLHLRRRLRSLVTILAAPPPDDVAEQRDIARAWEEAAISQTQRSQEAERERDEAVALISTVREEAQAFHADLDAAHAALDNAGCPEGGRVADRIVLLAAARDMWRAKGTPTPKRKPTAEERWEKRKRVLGAHWTSTDPELPEVRIREVLRGMDSGTARDIAMLVHPPGPALDFVYVGDVQRLVSDLARAGYLTVAKGPKGVPVYSLKEEG